MTTEVNPTEHRYLITIFDESGAVVTLSDLDHREVDEFRKMHMDDDLNYAIERSRT